MDLRVASRNRKQANVKEWPTRRMSLLVLPDVGLASLAGPLEVFSRATKIMTGTRRSPAYRIELLTTGDVLPISGLSLSLVGGRHWTEASIGNALAGREIARHLRELGTNTRGPAPLTNRDRSRFLSALDTAVQGALREAARS